MSWIDNAGTLWMFGGLAYSPSQCCWLNDLWQYNPLSNQWKWVSGSNTFNAIGVYGTQGVGAATNVPGARHSAATWIDSAGNLWMFGGRGYDSNGTTAYFNDLWKYNQASQQWVWLSGSSVGGASGVYGTQGIAAPGNVPSARYGSTSWADSVGNLWLFGGESNTGPINDLWKYNLIAQQWTWMGGAQVGGASGTYGTKGTSALSNIPGGRYLSTSWIDSAGKLWLFGGAGQDSSGTLGTLNDLWQYNPANQQWVWLSGSSLVNAGGTYGTQGVAASANVPGARYGSISWKDSGGNLWLFAGQAYDANSAVGAINDWWMYNPTTQQWTWMSGAKLINASGMYGALGMASINNMPGARIAPSSWLDSSGTLWLFGGMGTDSNGAADYLNDLWKRN